MAIGESGGQPDRPRAVPVSEAVHIDPIVRGGPVGCGKRRRVEAAAKLAASSAKRSIVLIKR